MHSMNTIMKVAISSVFQTIFDLISKKLFVLDDKYFGKIYELTIVITYYI